MDRIPLTYVYVAQVQAAAKALSRALDAMSDQRQDGATAAYEIAAARVHIENVYTLYAEGVRT